MTLPAIPSRVWVIGICGTAMASLAGMLKTLGVTVAGSDANVYPPMSTFLERLGIRVCTGFEPLDMETFAPELIVIGNALSRGNPQVEAALNGAVRYASMPETVREYFIRGKTSVVVTGTHGKTTTTSLMAWVLEHSGRHPSFLLGGIAENFGSSFQVTEGREFVIEGDEYDTAFFDKGPKFLHYLPRIVFIKNIEFDHADIYADLQSVKMAFRRLVNIVPSKGLILAGTDCGVVREIVKPALCRVVTYGLESGDWRADRIRNVRNGTEFALRRGIEELGTVWVPLAGAFNVDNALGVIAASVEMGLSIDSVREALAEFRSVKRRLELRGVVRGVTVYDDFAHHPTAVRETLKAVRSAHPGDRVWAVFEPRSQSSRRAVFEEGYIDAFRIADFTVLAQVFGKLSIPDEQILSPERVVAALRSSGRSARTFPSTETIIEYLAGNAKEGDQIVIMSNGGFDNIHERLLARLAPAGEV